MAEELQIKISNTGVDDKLDAEIVSNSFPFTAFKKLQYFQDTEWNIHKIHAVVFGEGEKEDLFINTENVKAYLKTPFQLNKIVDYFINTSKDFTINKLDCRQPDSRIFYDDDGQLIVEVKNISKADLHALFLDLLNLC